MKWTQLTGNAFRTLANLLARIPQSHKQIAFQLANINRTFFQSYLAFNNVLKTLAQIFLFKDQNWTFWMFKERFNNLKGQFTPKWKFCH